MPANTRTVRNFESTNSFLDRPSIRFCLMVLLLYSFDIIDTMTMARKSLNQAVKKVLKCQMYGKLKMPWSASWKWMSPKSKFTIEIRAMEVIRTKYMIMSTLLVLLFQSLINSICNNRTIRFIDVLWLVVFPILTTSQNL